MLCKEYISHDLFIANINETLKEIFEYLKEATVKKYIVVEDDNHKFCGMAVVEDLLSKDQHKPLSAFKKDFIKPTVQDRQHVLSALKIMESLKTEMVLVVDDNNEYVGEINQENIIDAVAKYLSISEFTGGMIVLDVNPIHYSIAEIIQIVQSGNADILQFNTQKDETTGNIFVSLIINQQDVSFIVSTFQRYEYNVKYYFGEESYDNELKSNYDLLMKYMNI